MMENEKWVEVNPGMIPPGDYSMRLQTGDFEGVYNSLCKSQIR